MKYSRGKWKELLGRGGVCWVETRMDLVDLEALRLGIECGGVVKPGCPLDKGGVDFTHCRPAGSSCRC